MKYLTNTFSPMMLSGNSATVLELKKLQDAKNLLGEKWESAISHDVTAKVLTALLGKEVAFNRVNLKLENGDIVIAIVPAFRASEAREFTYEEVAAAGFRCFVIYIA